MTHEPLTEAQLKQSQDWAEMNTCPYPLGAYLATIAEARIQRDAWKAKSESAERVIAITGPACSGLPTRAEDAEEALRDAQARVAALEAENARLRRALTDAAVPLEVMVVSHSAQAYREHSPMLMDAIEEAVDSLRAALSPAPPADPHKPIGQDFGIELYADDLPDPPAGQERREADPIEEAAMHLGSLIMEAAEEDPEVAAAIERDDERMHARREAMEAVVKAATKWKVWFTGRASIRSHTEADLAAAVSALDKEARDGKA